MSRTLILLVSCLAIACAVRVRYDNYRVYRITATNDKQLDALKRLDGASKFITFLDAVHYTNRSINVIVAPNKIYNFLQRLDSEKISYELLEENAQSKLEDDEVAKPATRSTEYNWEQYYELEDTYNWLESLVERFPKQVKLIEAGRTYEGRKILGIKISYKDGNKGVFLEGGMHAREWIGPATTTYITNQLLTSTNPDVRLIAENFDWYIVPHANPDGFVYTHTTDRLWRKTRAPHGDCYGADPNRNWDFHWNEVGSSNNPCSETYAGPEAFSDIETKSLSEYLATLEGKLLLYVSFHSYSQLLLFPYGHTGELPENYSELKRIYDVAVEAIGKRYGTKYTGGNIYDAIYPASGASVDWAYGTIGVKLAYCYELRPSSLNIWYGFRLPANQIIPTGEETLDSLLVMVREAGIGRFEFQEQKHPRLAANSAAELADKLLAFGGLLLYPFDGYTDIEKLHNLHHLLTLKYSNATYPTRTILRALAPKCEDMLIRCAIAGKPMNCTEIFFTRTTTVGVCCLFNYRRMSSNTDRQLYIRDMNASAQSSKIKFEISGARAALQVVLQEDPDDFTSKEYPCDGFRALLFYANDYPDKETGSVTKALLAYNEEFEVSIKPDILEGAPRMRQFSSKMRHCYFMEEGQALLKQEYYSFSECMLDCRTQSVVNHCGCMIPVLPGYIQNVSYCVLVDLPCINLWKAIWWQWNSFDYVSKEKKKSEATLELCNQCLPSCDVMSYKINVNSRPLIIPTSGGVFKAGILQGLTTSKPTTVAKFFYKSAFSQIKTHDISGDWIVLLGRYGGIMSIMYGFSIVAIIEWVYFVTGKWFTLWWKCLVECYRNRLHRKVDCEIHQDLYWKELAPKGTVSRKELNEL